MEGKSHKTAKAAQNKKRSLIQNPSDKAVVDYQLVRSRSWQSKAYAELMSRYKDSIYFMLLKMVNNRDDADDLIH